MAFTVPVCADPQTIWSPIGLSDLDEDEVLIVSLYRHWKMSATQPVSGAIPELVSAPVTGSASLNDSRAERLHENGMAAALETVFSLLQHHSAGETGPAAVAAPVAGAITGHTGKTAGAQRRLSWAESGLLALLSPVSALGAEAGDDMLDLDLAEALRCCRQQLASLGIDLRRKPGPARRDPAPCPSSSPTPAPAEKICGGPQNNGAGYVTAYVTALSIA